MAEVRAVRSKDTLRRSSSRTFQGRDSPVMTVEQLVAARSTSVTASSPTSRRIFAPSWCSSSSPVRRTGACSRPNTDRLCAVTWGQQNLAKLTREGVKLFRQGGARICLGILRDVTELRHARNGAHRHATCWARGQCVPGYPCLRAQRPRSPDAGHRRSALVARCAGARIDKPED